MADKKIICNDMAHETRVALLEDGDIVELFIERAGASDSTGNIYKGRVQRVLPGMQAAFVDIGLSQAAFLYVNDIIAYNFNEIESTLNPMGDTEDDNCGSVENGHNQATPIQKSEVNIVDLITEGQEMLVQVAKSPIGTKGARITSYISLPGRFLVLMPTSSHVGISRRIENEIERSRLKEMVCKLRDNNLGYIVRTAAEGVGEDKISQEMSFLKNLWSSIQQKYLKAPPTSMIHQELDIRLRAVRDLLLHEAETLIIDSRDGYQEILSFLMYMS